MSKTKQLTLLAASTKTTTSQGSWLDVATYNRPITEETDGPTENLLVVADVTAITGTLDLTVQGYDPLSAKGYNLPGGSFAQIAATGTYALRVPGPLPNRIRIAWEPAGNGKTSTLSVAAIPQGS